MKKKTRNIVMISAFATMVVAGAGFTAKYFVQKKAKEENKQKTEMHAQDLQTELRELNAEKAVLDSTYRAYTTKHGEYFLRAQNYKAQNPSCDNMDSVFVLADKVYDHVKRNYEKAESAFTKKLIQSCKRLCGKDGKYNFIEEGSFGYRKPEEIYDFLTILYENSESMPNGQSLIQEYERLEQLGELLYHFDGFINGDLAEYVYASDGQRDYDKRAADIVVKNDTLHFEGGYSLIQTEYQFMEDDNVYKRNTIDNMKQDEIVKVLYRDYLSKFKAFNSANFVIIEEPMYREIMDFMLQIRQHNDLEAGVVSYNVALKEISVRNSEIDATVANIRKELNGQTKTR